MQPLEFEVVESDKTVQISVRRPNDAIRRQSEQVYRRALQKAVSAGHPPRRKVLDRIDELWGVAEQARHEELRAEIMADEALLVAVALSDDEVRHIAERLRCSRAKWRQLRSEVDALERTTAEAIAMQSEFDFLVAACTFHGSGARYFPDVETYLAMRDQKHPVAHQAYWALAGELFGLREDYEDALPENVVLRHDALAC